MVFKVKINPVDLPVGWTTSTNYTISIGQGFVREIDGNKSPSAAQTITNAITTFATIPPTNLVSPVYNTTTRYPVVVLNYDREILFNSTATTNYYLYSGNTLTQTIVSTSSRITKTTGTVRLDLYGLVNTSTSYNIRADRGVFRDMFDFKPNAIENDSAIKFATSASYISLVPKKEIQTTPIYSSYRGGMSSAIGTNLTAIGSVSTPFSGTTTNTKSNVRIFNTSGDFLYQIENPFDNSYKFGSSISMTDSKIIIGATQGDGTTSKILIYNLTTSSSTLTTTITVPSESASGYQSAESDFGAQVSFNGTHFVTLSQQKWYLYSSTGTLVRSHYMSLTSYGPDAENAWISPAYQPVAINSTYYAYYEIIDTRDHVIKIYNITTGSLYRTIIVKNSFESEGSLSIQMDESYLIVGDIENDLCKIYELSTGNLIYTINSPETTPSNFGLYVGINQDYFMIADPSFSEISTYAQGKIYLYGRDDGLLKFRIDNPYFWNPAYAGANKALEFGIKPSIKNNTLISTVPVNFYATDETGSKIGDAYFYNI